MSENLQNRSYASRASPAEFACAVLIGFLYGSDLPRIFLSNPDGSPSDSFRLVSLALYAITTIMLVPVASQTLRSVRHLPLLFGFIILPFVSIAWSISPSDTFVRAIALLGSSLFGVYLALRFSSEYLLKVLAAVALCIGIVSFVLIIAVPKIGIDQGPEWPGTWLGVFGHKNSVGAMSALYSAFLAIYCANPANRRRIWPVIAFVLVFILMVASKSATSILVFAVSLLALLGLRSLTSQLRAIVLSLIVVLAPLAICLLIFADGTAITDIIKGFGKDPTLSGRIPIWETVIANIWTRPMLGFGYEAFWVQNNDAVRVIENILHFRPFYAHNGVLELMLSAGLVGTSLFAGLVVTYVWRLIQQINIDPTNMLSGLALVFLVAFAIRNFSEVSILTRNDLVWCLFVCFYIKLAETARQRTKRTPRSHSNLRSQALSYC